MPQSMINQELVEATLRGYTALFMERLRSSDQQNGHEPFNRSLWA